MPESGLETIRSQKHSAPIIAEGRTPAAGSRRVRRAGSRRQALIALFSVVVIGGLVTAAYFWFVPREDTFTLLDFTTARVATQTLQDTVELSGVVQSRPRATVTTPERSFMDQLLVNEGDWVDAGRLVALVDAEDLRNQLVSLQRSLERSLRDFDRFLLQHEYTLRSYERRRANLEKTVETARGELLDTQELFAIDSATRTDVRNAEERLGSALDALDDHDADVEESLALHALSRRNYEDDLLKTREEIQDIERRLARTRLTAPISGRVISVSTAARTSGELLAQYATVLEIADTRNPLVQTEIQEQYIPIISVGQPVAVEIAGTRLVGAIERIGQTAQAGTGGGTPMVELDVRVDIGSAEALPGSSALVEILIGEIPDAVVLPRGAYLTSGNRRHLYVVDGTAARRVTVEYGMVTSSLVEVRTGVQPGDLVITSSYQNYIDRAEIQLGGTR